MSEDKSKDIESIRKRWGEHANRYDEWYETFESAVENNEKFFNQVCEIVLKWSKEPSVIGMSRHLVLYGEEI